MRNRMLAAAVLGLAAIFTLTLANATDAGGDKGKAKKKVELKVKVGDTAPEFVSTDDTGRPFKSMDVVGKKTLVLFFYPAAFTGG